MKEAKSDACAALAGCTRVVDVSRVCTRSWHPFERLSHCLFPLYTSLSRVSIVAATQGEGQTCVTLEPTARHELAALLNALFVTTAFGNASAAALHPRLRFVEVSAICTRAAVTGATLPNAGTATRAVAWRGDTSVLAPIWPPNSTMWRALHRNVLALAQRRHTTAARVPGVPVQTGGHAGVLPTDVTGRREEVQPRAGASIDVTRGDHTASTIGILILRGANRIFAHEVALLARLERLSGLPFRPYFGNESVLQTIQLFSRAQAIVGYHGAGLINAVFVPRRVCLVEVTTYASDGTFANWCDRAVRTADGIAAERARRARAGADRTLPSAQVGTLPNNGGVGAGVAARSVMPWRTNRHAVAPWSPLVRWHCYRLPLEQVLETNGWPCGAPEPTDNRLKIMRRIALHDHDVDNIADTLNACLQEGGQAPLNGYGIDQAQSQPYSPVVNFKYDGAVRRMPYASINVLHRTHREVKGKAPTAVAKAKERP